MSHKPLHSSVKSAKSLIGLSMVVDALNSVGRPYEYLIDQRRKRRMGNKREHITRRI